MYILAVCAVALLRKKSVLSKLSSVLALSAVTPVKPLPLPLMLAAVMLPVILILPAPVIVPLKLSLALLRRKLPELTPSNVSASSPLPEPSLPACQIL
jgi:hypothetical protein